MALYAAILLLDLTSEIVKGLSYFNLCLFTFKAIVHEDNQGGLIHAQLEPKQHSYRSKFYDQKLHWFRSWFQPKQI